MHEWSFQDLFCERFRCPPSDFERRVFAKTLYWHAKPLALLLKVFFPNFFTEDLKFLRHLGQSMDLTDSRVDVQNYHDANRGHPGLLRTELRIRVSGGKAYRLACELFWEKREPGFETK